MGLDKILDLKLMGGFVVNCLVNTTFVFGNPIFDTLNKVSITIANFLADIIANPFSVFFLVKLLSTFVISASFLVKSGSLINLIVANPIDIHGGFAYVSTSTKSSTHAFIILISFTDEDSVIINPCNVGPAINSLAFLGPFVPFAGFFIEGGSIANLKAANPTVNIHGNFVLASTLAKTSTNISIISVGSTVDAGIVFHLCADVLSPIKPVLKLAPNTSYKKLNIYISCSTDIVYILSWHCQNCDCCDVGFSDWIYALSYIKHMSLIICDYYLHLLTSKLYLVNVSPANLCF